MIRFFALFAVLTLTTACAPLPPEKAAAINENLKNNVGPRMWEAADTIVEEQRTRRPVRSARTKRVWGCHTTAAFTEGMRYWVRKARYPYGVEGCGYERLDLRHYPTASLGYRDFAPYAVEVLVYETDEGLWYSPGDYFVTFFKPERL